MEQSLQGWATQGHIPIYTLWNKQVPDADSAACGKHRPDFTFVTDASAVVLEFDEYQHEPYTQSCELARMSDIYLSYRGLPVTFIRYNPDAFKVGGTTLVTKRETREGVLLNVLKEVFANEDFGHAIVVHYVCYDILAEGQPSGGSNYVQTHRFVDVNEYQTWAMDSTSAPR